MAGVAQFVQFDSTFIQNFWRGGQTFQGRSYVFAPFLFRGASSELNGENSEAFLAFATSDFTLGVIGNRSALNREVTITTVWVTSSLAIAPSPPPRSELFVINSVVFSDERAEIRLQSPVDAVSAIFPNRRLTSGLVGNLPREGQVRVA